MFHQFANGVLVYDVTRSLRGKQTTIRSAVKRAAAITINEQHALGDKKECRCRRTDDIAEVDIGELRDRRTQGVQGFLEQRDAKLHFMGGQ